MNQTKLLQHLGYLIFLIQISYSQVGIGTTTPEGALDIISTNDGLLIPRVALTNTSTATIVTPIKSELVYNTAATGDVTPGYYYWETTPTVASDRWIRLVANGSDWSITGNSGTSPGTNFIGTTDAQDFRIKTGVGGVDRWNISNTNNGQLQSYSLGTATAPTYSWQTDSNTGVFSPGADQLDFSTGGTARFRIPAADQVHALSLGTQALPFYSFSADTNTGVFSPGADILGFSTNSAERMRIEADGDVAIGTSSAAYKLYVRHDEDGKGVMAVDNATDGGFSGIYFRQNSAYKGHIGYVNTGGTSTFGGKGHYQLASGDRPMVFSVGTVGSELFLERMRIDQIGNVGIGLSPTAKLTLAAGTAAASTSPLKFTSGTNLTTPESGAVEFDGTNYFVTSGSTRYTLAKTLTGSASLNYGNTGNGVSEILTIIVTGAALGDPVILGIPNSVMTDGRLDFQAWVSAANTVSVRFLNLSGVNVNPGADTFKVSVVKF